ncbi:MAG: uracil-DNA glycosylase [Candidatus Omnitrophica bacterium]|nr:uracil-DNA glycosylase [Candidatus Omnitrophota bacterium]
MSHQFDLFDDGRNEILSSPDYGVFRDRLVSSGCMRCPLSEGRTHIVVDRGNPEARLMFIGEGPGENEDREGLAFVGRAGKLMDALMAEIGLDTNRDSLIVNVVKCRPPQNRAPREEEAGECLPYLKKQIELVRPRLIALLGATALKYIVPRREVSSMEQAVGKIFKCPEYPGVDFMVLYHPAYLLYDPRKKRVMMEHLELLKSLLLEKGITA